jgi:hypothetical protein
MAAAPRATMPNTANNAGPALATASIVTKRRLAA